MRWVPSGVIALFSALSAYAALPLYSVIANSGDPFLLGGIWTPLGMLFYIPILFAVVGGTAAVFRALWVATRRAELAASLALGGTRRALIRSHAITGMRDACVGWGIGTLVGAAARQLREGVGEGFWMADAVSTWLVTLAVAVACLAAAYSAVAAWSTRGSVADVASGASVMTGPGVPQRTPVAPEAARRSRRRRWVWAAVAALAIGAGVISFVLPSPNTANDDPAWRWVLSFGAGAVLGSVVLGVIPAALGYVGARLARGASLWSLHHLGGQAVPGTARALAGESLARPLPLRFGTFVAIIMVMGLTGALTVGYAGNEARNDLSGKLDAHASVSTVDLLDSAVDEDTAAATGGWAPGLPGDVLDDLHSDPALTVIQAGVLVTDVRTVDDPNVDGEYAARDVLLAVHGAAIDTFVPHATSALGLRAGTEWTWGDPGSTGGFGDGSAFVEVGDVRRDTTAANNAPPWTGIERGWAESVWGTSPTAAVLLFPAGGVSVADAMEAHDLAGLHTIDFGGSPHLEGGVDGGLVATIAAPFLLIAVAIIVGMAWASQRLRARDDATLLALGARAGSLRGAAVWEAALPTFFASMFGVLGGAVVGLVIEVINNAGTAGIAGAAFTASVMPWGALIGLVLGATALAAAGAALVRVRLHRLTPSAQLREAHKAGLT
ncbi:FtsX-like permease family protein [Demequina sp. NBRC 110051]|uniref:FtsX-like permease family protein n=1 Tax=Demequina sp. NBRC 110051 TaxID=1570340 RepID=UPI000A00AC79|nr:FtsX-like permease family protein [Demequina sp. NBRC 110051]